MTLPNPPSLHHIHPPTMSTSPKDRIPDEESDTRTAPLTMAASIVLTHLPKDASKALSTAGTLKTGKSTSRPPPQEIHGTTAPCQRGALSHHPFYSF